MASRQRTLVVIGSGPGIGRAVASVFAAKRYGNIALIARRAEQLEKERVALEDQLGNNVDIMTFCADVTDSSALQNALLAAERRFGPPECIFYNAARVLPSQFFEHATEDIEYDFKINVSGLYTAAKHAIPLLVDMAKRDVSSMPSIIVTSSMLPISPMPQLFALSLVKAAQRNLAQSMSMEYGQLGVFIGIINVGGPVSAGHPDWNPPNIASKAWEWLNGPRDTRSFEVKI